MLQQDRHTDGQLTPFQRWAQQYITYADGEVCEVGHKGSRGGGNGAEVLRIRRSLPDRKQEGARVSEEPRGSTPVSRGGADSCELRGAVLLFLSVPAVRTYPSVKCYFIMTTPGVLTQSSGPPFTCPFCTLEARTLERRKEMCLGGVSTSWLREKKVAWPGY